MSAPQPATNKSPRRVDWRRLAIESAAIVFSILLAFAVNAWWDSHLQAESERALMVGLLRDFESSRPQLESRIGLAKKMAAGNGELVQQMDSHGAGALSVPETLVLAVLGGPTYEAHTNTLDSALASGEIELLSDRKVRAALANWRRLFVDTSEDELEVRRVTNQQVVPLLSRSFSLKPYFDRVLVEEAADPEGRVSIAVSNELIGALALRKFYVDFAANDLTSLLESLDQCVSLLQQALAR